MPLDQSLVPQDLISALSERKLVLFLGAGISVGAGLPNWQQLLSLAFDWCSLNQIALRGRQRGLKQLVKSKNPYHLLDAATELRERMGEAEFRAFLQSIFNEPNLRPTENHLLAAELPFIGALTTNYDRLFETALIKVGRDFIGPYISEQTDALAGLLRSERFFLVKAHGDIERFDTIALGRPEYRKLMFANPGYRNFLSALFTTHPVLFVGFSLNDPDIRLLLDEWNSAFKHFGGYHYALLNAKEMHNVKTERERWRRDYRILVIPYTPTQGHPEVTQFFRALQPRDLEAFSRIMRRDDCKKLNVFQAPREFERIKSALYKHKVAILVGEPWVGKTFTALRLLYDYFRQEYNVLWIPSFAEALQEITDQPGSFLHAHPHTIIYLEDPLGRENVSKSAERMANSLEYILSAIRDEAQDTCIIMTSWRYPFYNVLDGKFILSEIKRKQILIEIGNESYTNEQLTDMVFGYLAYNKYAVDPVQGKQIVNILIPRLTRPGQIEDVVIRGKKEQDINRFTEIVEEVANVDEALPAEIKHMAPEELAMITTCYIYQDNPIDWVEACLQLAIVKLQHAGVVVPIAPRHFFEENMSRLLQHDWIRLVPFSEATILQFGHTTRAAAFRQSLRRHVSVRANVSAIVDGLLEEKSSPILIDLVEFLIASIDVMYPSDTAIYSADLERLSRRLRSLLERDTAVKGELAYSITGHIGRYRGQDVVRQLLARILDQLSIDADWQVRGMVAGAIAENFQILPKDVQIIFDMLAADDDPWVRFLVAESLVWRTTNLPPHYKELFETLVADRHPSVRGFIADTFCYIYNLDEIAQRVRARELLHNYFVDTDPIVVGWVLFGTIFHRDALPDHLVNSVLTTIINRGISEETEDAFADAARYHMSYLQVHSVLRHRQDMLRKFLAGATTLQQSLYRGSARLLPKTKPFSSQLTIALIKLAGSQNPEVRAGVLFIAVAHGESGDTEIEQIVHQLLNDENLRLCELAQSITSFFKLSFQGVK